MEIAFISVSTPAVKGIVGYARKIRGLCPDISFHIYHICGDSEASKIDAEKLCSDILSSDLLILDLMGADGGLVSRMTPALQSSRAQRIVISRLGPVSHRLGGYDEKKFRTDPEDAGNIELFSQFFRRCDPGDIDSAMNMILKRYFGYGMLPDPAAFSDAGDVYIKDPMTGRIFHSCRDFMAGNERWIDGRRKVALLFNGSNYPSDSYSALSQVMSGIGEFANVLPVAFNRYGCEDTSKLRELIGDEPDLIVAFMGFRFISGPMGGSSAAAMRFINDMDAPFLRPCFITRSTREEWMGRASGFQTMEFMINGFMPELDGGICIFPVGANEETESAGEWGITLSEVRIIDDRLDRLAGKIRGLLRLRDLRNCDKKIAIIGYNYPPGEGNLFGGSFLDTLGSIADISMLLHDSGYRTEPISSGELKHEFLDGGLLNDPQWIPAGRSKEIAYFTQSRHPESVEDAWGKPPGNVMASGKGYRIPGIVRGNLFIGIQPPRSGDRDGSKSYHDPHMPPHHQYLAFYEWVRDEFGADAVIHIGTHGTAEFLPGKENAMSGNCFPDMILGDVPHFYLYYAGNPSEAMIAKRRSHAALISYMPPPFVRSGLYGELSELEGLIAEYRGSLVADPGRSSGVKDRITEAAGKMRFPEDIDDLEHELEDIRASLIPSGFHRFGTGFSPEEAEEFAVQAMRFPHEGSRPLEEILRERGRDPGCAEEMFRAYNRTQTAPEGIADDPEMVAALRTERSIMECALGCRENANLLRALDGRFIDAKLGGDSQRNPEILPSGYNIVQFDPRMVPSESAFERGKEAAENIIELYRADNGGKYPESVAIVMWGLETSRTQGATIGQILHLLGFRMVRSAGDFENRFEPIPYEELGRPRIDVAVTICGFFRDMFSNLVAGLSRLFARLNGLGESDETSYFAKHTRENYSYLIGEGYSREEAEDLSVCRLFGPGEGLYGTGGITDAVNSGSWKEESELSDIFSANMGHAYSLRFRGRDVPGLMRANHSHVDAVSQMRDMEERELIDLDHYYEFFGGLCKTVESARGSKAAMYIADTSGPKIRTSDIRRSIEHGIRTRLLNPRWIDGMLDTDYHGAQHISDRFENVLGLAATTGAVGSGVFSDMEACYIADRDMRKRIRENNNWALMSMIRRLSEAHSRGYWDATDEELDALREAYLESEELAEEESDRDNDA